MRSPNQGRVLERASERAAAESRARARVRTLMRSPALSAAAAKAQERGDMVRLEDQHWHMGAYNDSDPIALFVRATAGLVIDPTGSAYIEPWAREVHEKPARSPRAVVVSPATKFRAASLRVGEDVEVRGVRYKVIMAEPPGKHTLAANPHLVAAIGLQRPTGKKVFFGWQFADGSVRI